MGNGKSKGNFKFMQDVAPDIALNLAGDAANKLN
jgi:hypothetical protein